MFQNAVVFISNSLKFFKNHQLSVIFYYTSKFGRKNTPKLSLIKIIPNFAPLLEAETGSAEEQPARNKVVTDEQNTLSFKNLLF